MTPIEGLEQFAPLERAAGHTCQLCGAPAKTVSSEIKRAGEIGVVEIRVELACLQGCVTNISARWRLPKPSVGPGLLSRRP